MNALVDKKKYIASIFFVFVLGAVFQVVVGQLLKDQTLRHHFRLGNLASLTYSFLTTLKVNFTGVVSLWQFAASGGFLAGVYIWLFERWLWKFPLLQGWFVRFPNMQGTWVGHLTPKTAAIQKSASSQASAATTWWQKKGILPVHVTLVHKFDGVTFTARHPNSQNTTRSAQLEHPERSDEIFLYVVYHNVPNDPNQIGSAIHDGCNELKFGNDGATLSATTKWSLQGKYWTDKPRAGSSLNDRGTWGQFNVHWESPRTDEASPDWTDQQRFFPK